MRWLSPLLFLTLLLTRAEAGGLASLSADQLVAYALEHAPRLVQARSRVEFSRLRLREAGWRWALLPRLSFSLGTGFQTIYLEGQGPYVLPGPSAKLNYGVHLSVSLDRILRNRLEQARARLEYEKALAELEQDRARIAAQVRELYHRLRCQREISRALELEVQAAEQLVKCRRIQFQQGEITRAVLSRSQVALAKSRVALLESQREEILLEHQLKGLIGWQK
ncbi:MAG: hypothetical protein DRP95_05525 [Candidatus Latescibacterota bacterium]|nr:MAG: hypothetical protein DRP95_05525 [Candidatus Latescibacterota bacterium]